MDVDSAVEMIQRALMTGGWVCAPVLVVSLVVGLLLGMLQTATSIQEPTVNQVPRTVATVITLLFLFPWGLQVIVDFTLQLWHTKP